MCFGTVRWIFPNIRVKSSIVCLNFQAYEFSEPQTETLKCYLVMWDRKNLMKDFREHILCKRFFGKTFFQKFQDTRTVRARFLFKTKESKLLVLLFTICEKTKFSRDAISKQIRNSLSCSLSQRFSETPPSSFAEL